MRTEKLATYMIFYSANLYPTPTTVFLLVDAWVLKLAFLSFSSSLLPNQVKIALNLEHFFITTELVVGSIEFSYTLLGNSNPIMFGKLESIHMKIK